MSGKVQDIETKEDLVAVLTQIAKPSAAERARRLCIISGMGEEATKDVVAELFSPPRVTAALQSPRNMDGCEPARPSTWSSTQTRASHGIF